MSENHLPGLPAAVLGEPDAAKQLAAVTVDCATCPFSLQCVASTPDDAVPDPFTVGYPTGYVCNKCKSFSMVMKDAYVIVDCATHNFPKRDRGRISACALCRGSLAQSIVTLSDETYQLLPTANAKFPVKKRIDAYKKMLEQETEHGVA